jgi:uncharacterized phage protein (TIGR01671 family)
MREIKFRIWNKKLKRWHQGGTDPDSIRNKTDSVSLFGEIILFGELLHDQHEDGAGDYDNLLKAVDDLIALQCTGLKDKNGAEIYEGDIVSISYIDDQFNPKPDSISEVVYDNSYAGFIYKHIRAESKSDSLYQVFQLPIDFLRKRVEVIGNIYENPELLGETSENL